MRWKARLDWSIGQSADFPLKKISLPVLNLLRLALYQILFLDRVPESAAVNEAVKQAKKRQPPYVVSLSTPFSETPVATKTKFLSLIAAKALLNIYRYSIPIRNGWCGNGSGSGELILQRLSSKHRTASPHSRCDPIRSRSIEAISSIGLKRRAAFWESQPLTRLRESGWRIFEERWIGETLS